MILDSKSNGNPWLISKGQDCFLPISKIISRDNIDPHNLEISLYINGELRQSDNTGNMHFKIYEQMDYISRYMKLLPGDYILTGTPSGVNKIEIGDKVLGFIKSCDGKTLVEIKFDVEEKKMKSKF